MASRAKALGSSLARAMKPNTSSSDSTVVPKSARRCTQSCWASIGGAEPGSPGNAKAARPVEVEDGTTDRRRRQIAERAPARGQGRVDPGGGPGLGDVEGRAVRGRDGGGVEPEDVLVAVEVGGDELV